MTAHLFGNTIAEDALKVRKQKATGTLTGLLEIVKERGHVAMVEERLTLVSHQNDLLLPKRLHEPVSRFTLLALAINSEPYDLVLYRVTIDHEVGFGLYNGPYVDPRKEPAVCVTMRPLRFVEQFAPRTAPEGSLDEGFEMIDSVILTLQGLFPPA